MYRIIISVLNCFVVGVFLVMVVFDFLFGVWESLIIVFIVLNVVIIFLIVEFVMSFGLFFILGIE